MKLIDDSIVPSRVEFNRTVCGFKTKHKIKLRELFSKTVLDISLHRKFLSEPAIITYLSRSSELVKFLDYHPNFDVARAEKKNNDYYEEKIYRLIHANNLEMFLYRENILTDDFYRSGTDTSKLNTFLTRINKEMSEIVMTPALDIYQIRSYVAQFQFLKEPGDKTRFVLSPNDKDGHAFPIVCIVDQASDRILASIFLNSWINNDYLEDMQNKLIFAGTGGFEPISRGDPKIEKLYQKIKSELKGESFLIDASKKIGYLLDLPEFRDSTTANKIHSAVREGHINVVHNLYKCREEYVYRVKDIRQISFINSCHDLQVKGDYNCGLYTFNFLQAIVELLRDQEKAERVYQLALQLNDSDIPEKRNEAKKELAWVFKEELKDYLPFYYDQNGLKKNEKELREYHLRQRWDLDGQLIRDCV